MAFSDKYQSEGEQCPVCRQIFTMGRKIRESAYGRKSSLILCEKCYQRYYRNASQKRDIAIEDNAEKIRVKFCPAESLEHDRFFKKERPQAGYEFPLSYLLTEQILHDVIIWGFVCMIMRLCLYLIYADGMQDAICWLILKYFTLAGCIIGIAVNIWNLLRSVFYGIGMTRKLTFTGAIIILIVMIFVTI